jgi:hypothetical protein
MDPIDTAIVAACHKWTGRAAATSPPALSDFN